MSEAASHENVEMASLVNGVASVVLGVYLAFVVYRGNVTQLGKALYQDGTGWLEFLIALYLLSVLYNNPRTREITGGLVGLAIVALLFRLITNTDTSAFSQFQSGQLSLFQFVGRLAGLQ